MAEALNKQTNASQILTFSLACLIQNILFRLTATYETNLMASSSEKLVPKIICRSCQSEVTVKNYARHLRRKHPGEDPNDERAYNEKDNTDIFRKFSLKVASHLDSVLVSTSSAPSSTVELSSVDIPDEEKRTIINENKSMEQSPSNTDADKTSSSLFIEDNFIQNLMEEDSPTPRDENDNMENLRGNSNGYSTEKKAKSIWSS